MGELSHGLRPQLPETTGGLRAKPQPSEERGSEERRKNAPSARKFCIFGAKII